MPASYEVVRQAVAAFTSPAALRFMVEGNYEVGGILPVGAAYPVVRDRRINSVEALAGRRIAAFDHDRAQALMIQRIGAQPVSADITNFSTKFNNGMVDMIGAPALAYRPLEIYKGVGKQGAVGRFPLLILTYQVILNRSKFPPGFGEKSRQYWLDHFDGAMSLVANAPHADNGRKVLDFTLSDEGQAIWSNAFLRPVIAGTASSEAQAKFLPAADYARAGTVDYAQMAAAQRGFSERYTREAN